jgi:hypothetical protein
MIARPADLRCRRAAAAGLCGAASVRVLEGRSASLAIALVWRDSTKDRVFRESVLFATVLGRS